MPLPRSYAKDGSCTGKPLYVQVPAWLVSCSGDKGIAGFASELFFTGNRNTLRLILTQRRRECSEYLGTRNNDPQGFILALRVADWL